MHNRICLGMSIHRRWKLLLCCKSVLLLFFVKNCGTFLLEIGFLKALYMGLSQMIKYLYHFLLDNISIY